MYRVDLEAGAVAPAGHRVHKGQLLQALIGLLLQLPLFQQLADVNIHTQINRIIALPVHTFAGDLQPGIVALPVSGLGHEVDGLAPAHDRMVFLQYGPILALGLLVQEIVGPAEELCEFFIGLHELKAIFHDPELGDKTGNIIVGDALLKQGLLQFADIRHYRVGHTIAVDHFLREDGRQSDPHHPAAFVPHPAYKLVAAFGNRVRHFCDQNLPVLRVVLVKFVRAVLEKPFVFFFGVADQFVIILISPDKRKMFIHQMLAHAQAREIHQHVVFVALADGIFNEDFFLVFHGGPSPCALLPQGRRENYARKIITTQLIRFCRHSFPYSAIGSFPYIFLLILPCFSFRAIKISFLRKKTKKKQTSPGIYFSAKR